MIEERTGIAEALCIPEESDGDRWLPLGAPCLFQGRHYALEVRSAGGVPVRPIGERDVRVRAPLCLQCRAPMEVRYRVPAYDCFACPSGDSHGVLFCARGGEGPGLFANVVRRAALILASPDPEAVLTVRLRPRPAPRPAD